MTYTIQDITEITEQSNISLFNKRAMSSSLIARVRFPFEARFFLVPNTSPIGLRMSIDIYRCYWKTTDKQQNYLWEGRVYLSTQSLEKDPLKGESTE